MPKQYTFKTTKNTTWMEDILNKVDSSVRSAFIREMLTVGFKQSGLVGDTEVIQNKYFSEVAQPKVTPNQTEATPNQPKVTPQGVTPIEPIFEEVSSDIEDIDLDSKLDSLYD